MVYELNRVNGGPTQHQENANRVTADVLEIGFVFAFGILFLSFLLILPGFRGIKKLYFLLRIVISLFICSAILLGVLGQEWEDAKIETRTPYKVFTTTEINASIGLKIGLASVNITLKGEPVLQLVQETNLPANNTHWMEYIDYNERFHWYWRQGRFGFGPYSGRIARELRQAQYRGLPIPILWVAEYFALDGELIRWGRSFRTAGWYTYQTLWTAFPTWIIANILSAMVLFYAGWMFVVTGGFMLVSIVIYSTIRWGSQPLVIPFEDASLSLHYGPSFYLTLVGGIVSVLYGLLIVLLDYVAPQAISTFFDIDVLQDPEEFYHTEKQADDTVPSRQKTRGGGAAKRIQARGGFSTRLGKSSRRIPRPSNKESQPLRTVEERDPQYMNRKEAQDNKGFENDEVAVDLEDPNYATVEDSKM